MSLIIRIEDNNEVHVSLNAATITTTITLLERAHRALCELADPTPTSAPDASPLTRAELTALLDQLQPLPAAAPVPPLPPSQDDQPTLLATTQPTQPSNPLPPTPAASPAVRPSFAQLRAEIDTTGHQLFGEAWSSAAGWLATIWTTKYTPTQVRADLDLLTCDECQAIHLGLIDHAASVQAEWRKHQQNAALKSPAAPAPKAASRHSVPSGRRSSATAAGPVVMATG